MEDTLLLSLVKWYTKLGSWSNRVSRITGSFRRLMPFGMSFQKKNAMKQLKS